MRKKRGVHSTQPRAEAMMSLTGNGTSTRRRFLKVGAAAAALGYVAPSVRIARAGSGISGAPVPLPVTNFHYDSTVRLIFDDAQNTEYDFTFDVGVSIDGAGNVAVGEFTGPSPPGEAQGNPAALQVGGSATGTFVSGNNSRGTIDIADIEGSGAYNTGTTIINTDITALWADQGFPPNPINVQAGGPVTTGGWSLDLTITGEPAFPESGGVNPALSPDVMGTDLEDKDP